MKQFSLDEYLKNPSRKVVTRDGRNVKIYCTNFARGSHSIVAEIEGEGKSTSFSEKGKYYNYELSKNDLFFATVKHEGWVNVYKTESGDYVTGRNVHINKEHAEALVGPTCVSTIKLEWEE